MLVEGVLPGDSGQHPALGIGEQDAHSRAGQHALQPAEYRPRGAHQLAVQVDVRVEGRIEPVDIDTKGLRAPPGLDDGMPHFRLAEVTGLEEAPACLGNEALMIIIDQGAATSWL